MNLKILSITVLILAVLSAIVAWFDRPVAPADADPRVGTSLLADIPVNDAQTISVTNNDDTVALSRGTNGDWQVDSYHGLPADTDKLRRLLGDLSEAEILRVVTRNPERAARLDLGSASVTIDDASISFGQNASRGGRYLRLAEGDDAPVYLTAASVFLDGSAKNWANAALTAFETDDIQSVTLTFPEEADVTATRESVEAAWTADLADGEQIREQPITSLLNTLRSLRFSDTSKPDAPEAQAARDHARTFTITTFGGETLSWSIGRKPAETTIKEAEADPVAAVENLTTAPDFEPESAEDVLEDLTETIPAGPVYVSFEGSADLAPLIGFQDEIAFRVSDFVFNGLPADRSAIIEPAPIADTEEDPPFDATE